jgi:hypothetical protein
MKPVFILGYCGRPHFLNPADADFAVVSPPFNGVDVGNIGPQVADHYECVIIRIESYLFEPRIRVYQFL